MTLTIDWNNPTYSGTLQSGGVISSWYKIDLVTPSIILKLKDKTPLKPHSVTATKYKLQSIQYPPGMAPKGKTIEKRRFESYQVTGTITWDYIPPSAYQVTSWINGAEPANLLGR